MVVREADPLGEEAGRVVGRGTEAGKDGAVAVWVWVRVCVGVWVGVV